MYTFGIGSSVNRHLIEGLARAGMSEPFVVTEPREAASAAERFREYISAPVLTDVEVTYQGFDAYDVEPVAIPDVFADRPVIVHGKWRGPKAGTITLSGVTGDGTYARSFDASRLRAHGDPVLAHLWARTRIRNLSDKALSGNGEEIKAEITALGLRYSLLTRYTSFIAVDRIVRNPNASGRDVEQPLPLPQGVEGSSVGQAVQVASEPELWIILSILAAMLMLVRGRASAAGRRWTRGSD